MASPHVQLRRSSRKSILPSHAVGEVNTIKRSTMIASASNSFKPSFKYSSTPDLNKSKPDVKNSETTPKSSKISHDTTTKTHIVNPMMARLQRDMNSPSAAARVRANKALKSPSFLKQAYGQFDVPHERLDLVTEEERKPIVPKTVEEIFKECKIYVEVRSGDDNRSAGIKNRLLREGINVNEKLYKDTTHVIFKDGLLSTYKNANKMRIPITTILWIDACKNHKRLVDPSSFEISNLDRYEHPELYPRLRRQKSMQPEARKISTIPFIKSMTQEEQKKVIDEMFEEINEENEGMDFSMQNKDSEKTLCQKSLAMDIEEKSNTSDKWNRDHRRITTFTPTVMEQTGVAANLIVDRRRTLFTPQLLKQTETPPENIYNSFRKNTLMFNSSNRIAKNSRRSVFDISMNILDLNCKAMSQKSQEQKQIPSSDEKLEVISVALKSSEKKIQAQVVKPQGIRKRKLFTEDYEVNDDFKENNNDNDYNKTITYSEKKPKLARLSVIPSYKTPLHDKKTKPKIDRRQTLAFFKDKKVKQVSVDKIKTPVKSTVSIKVIVCTNMSQEDKRIIQTAILKLGGKVEAEVTMRTTHVVTPNEERTMNVLRGVIQACEIVNVKWVHESLAADKWLETGVYLHGICDSNRVYERSVLGIKNYKNMTFLNISFFFNKETIDSAKKVDYMKEVITLCNGKITEKKSEARLIISDQPLSNDSKLVVVNSMYIFDSAMKGTCLECLRYVPKQV